MVVLLIVFVLFSINDRVHPLSGNGRPADDVLIQFCRGQQTSARFDSAGSVVFRLGTRTLPHLSASQNYPIRCSLFIFLLSCSTGELIVSSCIKFVELFLNQCKLIT